MIIDPIPTSVLERQADAVASNLSNKKNRFSSLTTDQVVYQKKMLTQQPSLRLARHHQSCDMSYLAVNTTQILLRYLHICVVLT